MPRNWPKNETYDSVFKLVLVGDAGIGKSSLVHRFTENTHSQGHVPTIGVDFKIRTVAVDGRSVKLHLWDTTGNERFRSITTAYYRAAHGIAICFDTTDAKTFERIGGWFEAVEQFASSGVRPFLIGTKSDLTEQRQVPAEAAARLAASRGLSYVETSSLRDENVQAAFESITREMARRQAKMASQRRDNQRAGGGALRSAVGEWRPPADGCCSCLPFLRSMLTSQAPPLRWSPVSVRERPGLASVEVA